MLLVLANTKGGVGKTTLAVHLAVLGHDLGRRVALLDVDEQFLSSRWVRNVEPAVSVHQARTPKQIADQLAKLGKTHDLAEVTQLWVRSSIR